MQKYGAAIIMAIALVSGIIYLSTTSDIMLWGDFGLIALLSVALGVDLIGFTLALLGYAKHGSS